MPSPYSFLPELATTDRIAGALHTGAHLNSLRHCLRGRPSLFSPKGEPTFFATRYVRWRHFPLLMLICILGHQRRPLCARYLGGVSSAGFPSGNASFWYISAQRICIGVGFDRGVVLVHGRGVVLVHENSRGVHFGTQLKGSIQDTCYIQACFRSRKKVSSKVHVQNF